MSSRFNVDRSRSSSPRSRKHRNSKRDEEDSYTRKHHKKKSHKRQRHSDNGSEEDIKYPEGFKHISEDDYYSKSTEFRLWLREYKNKFFDEMKTEEAHRYFKKFVNYWNKVKLDKKYYKGMRSSQLTSSESTRYKWNIDVNRDELDTIKNSVDRQTNVKFATEVQLRSSNNSKSNVDNASRNNYNPRPSRIIGPTMPPPTTNRSYVIDEEMDREDKERYERSLKRKEQKEFRKTHEAVLDELLPKATGREAMIEKKKTKNAYYRRETSPDIILNDDDLMGGDDFQARLNSYNRSKETKEKRKQVQKAEKAETLKEKAIAYQAKERDTIEMFKKMAEEQRKAGKGLWGQADSRQ